MSDDTLNFAGKTIAVKIGVDKKNRIYVEKYLIEGEERTLLYHTYAIDINDAVKIQSYLFQEIKFRLN